jgi:hypothetical protein
VFHQAQEPSAAKKAAPAARRMMATGRKRIAEAQKALGGCSEVQEKLDDSAPPGETRRVGFRVMYRREAQGPEAGTSWRDEDLWQSRLGTSATHQIPGRRYACGPPQFHCSAVGTRRCFYSFSAAVQTSGSVTKQKPVRSTGTRLRTGSGSRSKLNL